jgi:membrane associated rhomboid family serine protease
MLIPIGHENMSARRWPIVTLALITINTLVFLFTNFAVEDQLPKLQETRTHILMLAAMHPELNVPADAQKTVSDFQEQNPKTWAYIKREDRPIEDAWDAKLRATNLSTESLQEEMNSLSADYSRLATESISQQYGFVPAESKPLTYITANFLHGGWLHLIGNMWFLWLAGFVLEDNWGRIVYTVFYFIAGAAALQMYAWTNPGSMMPAIGASGAVAALMGAFMVRFPKMKIEMMWLIRFRTYRFKAAAYWLLPLWLLTEILYGVLLGKSSGVAHWAHVGGFVFGAVAACILRFSNLEHKVNQAIEEKTTWESDPAIVQATDLFEKNQLEDALALLTEYTATHPDSLDACNLIHQIYWRKGDIREFHQATLTLCSLHLKAREYELAWQCLDEFRNTEGKEIPAAIWFDLCRAAESLKNFELALSEYQKLIAAYPNDREGLLAQVAAGRICLTQLKRPQDALSYFQAAEASPIPHLDWEQTIQAGIRNAKAARNGPQSAASAVLAKR